MVKKVLKEYMAYKTPLTMFGMKLTEILTYVKMFLTFITFKQKNKEKNMGYWKLSFETIMEIREKFKIFIDECMEGAERLYNKDMTNTKYYLNKLRRDSYYMTPSEFWEKERKMKEEDLARRNRRVNNIQKMIDNFTFFIDVVEFERFTSSDYGKTIVFNFHELTVKRISNPNLPANKFNVNLSGIRFSYDTYDYYEFLPNKIQIKYDYYN